MDATLDATSFSALLRSESHEQHTAVAESSFMRDLLGGELGLEAFTRYTEQLWFVYHALEDDRDLLAADPVAGPFVRPELPRVPALEADLDFLHGGTGWRSSIAPLRVTAAYAARIAECARDWPAGYVAHHYTRYLGDLSGGQVVRGTAEKTWGFDRKGDGVRFYVFEDVDNPAAFKRNYRALLDAAPLDDLEKQRAVAECRRAFEMNMAILRAMEGPRTLSA